MSLVVKEARIGVGGFFLLDREQTNRSFRPCFVERILRHLLCSLFDRSHSTCASLLLCPVIDCCDIFVVCLTDIRQHFVLVQSS